MPRPSLFRCLCLALVLSKAGMTHAQPFYVANGKAWPGTVLVAESHGIQTLFSRPLQLPEALTPRVQSISQLPGGNIVFCSGLDRSIMEWTRSGERTLHQGGYLARQVRTDIDGTLYWSGLETPLEGNPLPDGFIYRWDASARQPATLLTFSQRDTKQDWWGAFDVHRGRIFVSTLHAPTTIYEIVDSIPRPVVQLPMGVTAFRIRSEHSLDACDGQGKLYHFPDMAHPENNSVLLDSPVPFVDFIVESPSSS